MAHPLLRMADLTAQQVAERRMCEARPEGHTDAPVPPVQMGEVTYTAVKCANCGSLHLTGQSTA
jgi:hypothetical protein